MGSDAEIFSIHLDKKTLKFCYKVLLSKIFQQQTCGAINYLSMSNDINIGHGFDSWPFHIHIIILDEMFTHASKCLSHRAVMQYNFVLTQQRWYSLAEKATVDPAEISHRLSPDLMLSHLQADCQETRIGLWLWLLSSRHFLKGSGSLWAQISEGRGVAHQPLLMSE